MTVLWDVDTQVDFMLPDGKLYVRGAEETDSRDEALVDAARTAGIVHVASADDHELTDDEISDDARLPDHLSAALPPWDARGARRFRRPSRTILFRSRSSSLPERYLAGREFLLLKKSFDVFTNPNTDRLLEWLDPDEIVVFGVATDVCDDAAIRGFLARGLEVRFVEDAARGLDDERVAICTASWREQGVEFTSAVEAASAPSRLTWGVLHEDDECGMPGVDLHQFMVDLRDFVVNWWPLLGLTFYCVLLYIFWRMLQLMPRVKPATVIVDPRTAIDWNDIAGADEAKMELAEIVEFLRDPKRFEQLGAVVPKGVLLYGPPGTGKTLLARATATESGAKFYAQSASAFVEMFAGLGAARIRKLFDEARKNAPSIIFIDELDAVGSRAHRAAASTASRIRRSTSCSSSSTVSPRATRSSSWAPRTVCRISIRHCCGPAASTGSCSSLRRTASAVRRSSTCTRARSRSSADVQLDLIARQTSGLTGADLANIANEAAILAGRREAKYVGAADFDNALERIVAGLQQKKVLTDKERRILAYHEAGHALMSHLMGEVGHLQKVTIVSRGNALGYTLHLPNEDRYMESKEELIDMLKIALAGRAAEQVVFGRVTNGAASDLERATEIARAMVFEWGMSDVVTSRTLRADNYALSEETKRVRDNEQARLTDDAYAEAVRLIEKHRSSLDRLSQALLEKETLMREEVLLLLTDVEAESRASETVGTPRVVVPLSNEA